MGCGEPVTAEISVRWGQGQCIVDVNAEIPDRILNVGMAQQNLHGSKVPVALRDPLRPATIALCDEAVREARIGLFRGFK